MNNKILAVPILDEDTLKFVHHFTVYLVKECEFTLETAFYRSMIYAWAPGDAGTALPNDVGFPLFDTENKQALFIEIHYHNPSLVSGMIDSSGMRFYYVNEERTHKAGILEIGDPWVMLYDTDISDGLTQYSFTCPGDCSNSFVAEEGVTILSEGT
jgi:dopamine beta-monooxygenase